MIRRLFGKEKTTLPEAGPLYRAILARSRDPVFYADLGVPDTFTGRFEVLCLHVALVMLRLSREPEPDSKTAGDLSKALLKVMFEDMDRALRQSGVGDLSMSKHVRRMMTAFYGRAQAYERALNASSHVRDRLSAAVSRNVYGTIGGAKNEILELWADYILANFEILAQRGYSSLACGDKDSLPEPEILLERGQRDEQKDRQSVSE